MALTATVDVNANPVALTVVCDFRAIAGTVTVLGQTTPFAAIAPIDVDDPDATWEQVSDDGTTAVYHLA